MTTIHSNHYITCTIWKLWQSTCIKQLQHFQSPRTAPTHKCVADNTSHLWPCAEGSF